MKYCGSIYLSQRHPSNQLTNFMILSKLKNQPFIRDAREVQIFSDCLWKQSKLKKVNTKTRACRNTYMHAYLFMYMYIYIYLSKLVQYCKIIIYYIRNYSPSSASQSGGNMREKLGSFFWNTKIADFCNQVFVQQDVAGLHISVNHWWILEHLSQKEEEEDQCPTPKFGKKQSRKKPINYYYYLFKLFLSSPMDLLIVCHH